MKKTISFLLTIILLLSVFAISTSAETNQKLSTQLAESLNNMSDTDKIHVWIMLGKLNTKSDSELERMAYEECGLSYGDTLSVDQKNQVRRKKLELMYHDRHQAVKELLSKMGVAYSDVVGGWNDNDPHEGWKPEFYLTKSRILNIVDIEEIDTIDLCYDNYYLVGSMNDWKIDQAYRLHNRGEGILEITRITLSEKDVFKIVKSDDGSTYSESDCYPVEGNYNDDGTLIKCDSPYYYLEFCPASNQEDSYWHDGTIYLENLEPPEDDSEPLNVYDKLCAYLSEKGYAGLCTPNHFEELYRHVDSDGEADWVLLNAYVGEPYPWYGMGIIGNRVIISGTYPVFTFGMALYDVKEDTFYDLYTLKDYDHYDGIAEAIDLNGKGKLLGDLDGDDNISILDATLIQRCEINVTDYPESDWINESDLVNESFNPIHYYSDFNRDGDRNILDATCIQRYLIGATYPIG